MIIPKPRLAFVCRLYKIGSHVLMDKAYVLPENIHHWVGGNYEADDRLVLISKVLLSPAKWAEVFANH